jgi:hypothetical protein
MYGHGFSWGCCMKTEGINMKTIMIMLSVITVIMAQEFDSTGIKLYESILNSHLDTVEMQQYKNKIYNQDMTEFRANLTKELSEAGLSMHESIQYQLWAAGLGITGSLLVSLLPVSGPDAGFGIIGITLLGASGICTIISITATWDVGTHLMGIRPMKPLAQWHRDLK